MTTHEFLSTVRKAGSPRRPEPSSGRTRVLIVDDHALVRYAIARLIENEADLEVCGEAADVTTAMRLVEQSGAQVAIVDVSLGSGNGIELIKQIHAYEPAIRMVALSMHDESVHADKALRAGARGYVNKKEPARTIISAIRRVLAGHVFLSQRMTERLVDLAVGADTASKLSPVETLSDRELEVFEMIGAGLSVKQIAEQLHISPKTVEYHRQNTKQKLGLATAVELTRYAVAWMLETRRSP